MNGLKSVFGGLKNYLYGGRDMPTPTSRIATSPNGSQIVEENGTKVMPKMSSDELYNSHPINRLRNDPMDRAEAKIQSNKGAFDQRLEQNLEDMCGSLSRLKGLATDLQGEIVSQNDLIDNMNYKMEDVDIKVNKQSKEMNKLLGKK